MKNSKLWLCGITQNRKDDIDDMTKDIAQYFDGLIFVDGYSDDGTYELLDERKGEGKIIQRKWTNDHDLQMNEFLRQGPMQNGDWFLMLDSPDKAKPEWCEQLREEVKGYNEEGIGAVSFLSKIQLARYVDSLFYFNTPHWGLHGILGNIKHYYSEDEKYQFIQSKRLLENDPTISALLHPVKYYYVYGRSNHTSLMYGPFGEGAVGYHENIRLRFRLYCSNVLGLDYSMESLEEYLRKKDFTEEFIEVAELEYSIKDVFRLKVLDQTFEEINDNRSKNGFFSKKDMVANSFGIVFAGIVISF